jgi:hypothetical protein
MVSVPMDILKKCVMGPLEDVDEYLQNLYRQQNIPPETLQIIGENVAFGKETCHISFMENLHARYGLQFTDHMLENACLRGNLPMAQYIYENGVDFSSKCLQQCLQNAVIEDHLEILKWLLDEGLPCNPEVLEWAIYGTGDDCMHYLIQKRKPISSTGLEGFYHVYNIDHSDELKSQYGIDTKYPEIPQPRRVRKKLKSFWENVAWRHIVR